MTFLQQICQAFEKADIRYAIVGGHAVALYGAVRGTVDIDCILDWSEKSLVEAENTLKAMGLISRLPISAQDVFHFREEYIQNRNLLAWSFYNPNDLSQQLDILINMNLKGRKTTMLMLGSQSVHLLNLDDLIAMKREAGRPQDLADIEALESLK